MMDTIQPDRLPHLTDEQVVALMLQATGEDWDESDAWKLRVFVHNVSIDIAAVAPTDATQAPNELRGAIEEVADYLEESANLSIVSQFTAISEWIDSHTAPRDFDAWARAQTWADKYDMGVARIGWNAALAAPVAPRAAGDAAQAELVTRLRRALYQIAHWPDDGTPCSQEKIKHFAIGVLDGDPVEPLAAVGVLHPHDALRYMACRESAIERGLFATPEEYDAMVDDSLRKKGKEVLTGRGNNYGKKVAKDGSLYRATNAAPVAPAAAVPQPYALRFPTMLRKMWSGSEVQAWLDELPRLYEVPTRAQGGYALLIERATPVEPNQSTPVSSQSDRRATFEIWAKPRGYDLTRCSPVPYAAYKSDFTNGALAGWFGAHESPTHLSTDSVDKPVQIHDQLQTEIARLNAIINTPHSNDFLRAVSIEAEHQRQRWGSDHDGGKTAADWFWLIGYLGGNALHAHVTGNTEKAEHHVITTAAACANWHLALFGKADMRPGVGTETAATGDEA